MRPGERNHLQGDQAFRACSEPYIHMQWLYREGGTRICMTHAGSGLGAYKQLGACGGGPSRGKSADAREAPVGARATGIQEFGGPFGLVDLRIFLRHVDQIASYTPKIII